MSVIKKINKSDVDYDIMDAYAERSANKVSSFQGTPDNTHFPTEKLVKDNLDTKVAKTQTVNGKALSGNITLTAEDITYSGSGSHTSGSVGKEISDTKTTIDGYGLSVVSGKLCQTYNE